MIAKKYVVDIFEDGTQELTAMLKVMWDAFYVLSFAPIKIREYRYNIAEKKDMIGEEASELLSVVFSERFERISDIAADDLFLSDKSEEQLFKLYNIMLDTDIYHYMTGKKGAIIPYKCGENS